MGEWDGNPRHCLKGAPEFSQGGASYPIHLAIPHQLCPIHVATLAAKCSARYGMGRETRAAATKLALARCSLPWQAAAGGEGARGCRLVFPTFCLYFGCRILAFKLPLDTHLGGSFCVTFYSTSLIAYASVSCCPSPTCHHHPGCRSQVGNSEQSYAETPLKMWTLQPQ